MNAWLVVAAVLLVCCLGPCVLAASQGTSANRLIAVNLSGTVTTAILLVLAQGYGRTSYFDLALVTSLLTPIGTLVFTRLLRGLPSPSEPEPRAAGTRDGLT